MTTAIHEHNWAATGLWVEGQMEVPCREPECVAALVGTQRGWVVRSYGYEMQVNGIPLEIEDDPEGSVAKVVVKEIKRNPILVTVALNPGDVVLDIGAHVGIVSVFLAKRAPQARIIAFEPVPDNFARLERNLLANNITNVTAVNKAVTANGKPLVLSGDSSQNSGGFSAFTGQEGGVKVESTTLKAVFKDYAIDRVRLLKIDAEGSEHPVLLSSGTLLERVDYLTGEIHISQTLLEQGHTLERLAKFCSRYFAPAHIHVSPCRIGG